MTLVRPAHRLDARGMAELLRNWVEGAETTAITGDVDAARILSWMAVNPERSAWHVAEAAHGEITGFQWIAPHPDLPPDACDIASFVQTGHTGLGIGSALFSRTEPAARSLGYRWINASIRADNTGGLAYYRSRGFRPWRGHQRAAPSASGARAKIYMWFDLE